MGVLTGALTGAPIGVPIGELTGAPIAVPSCPCCIGPRTLAPGLENLGTFKAVNKYNMMVFNF